MELERTPTDLHKSDGILGSAHRASALRFSIFHSLQTACFRQ